MQLLFSSLILLAKFPHKHLHCLSLSFPPPPHFIVLYTTARTSQPAVAAGVGVKNKDVNSFLCCQRALPYPILRLLSRQLQAICQTREQTTPSSTDHVLLKYVLLKYVVYTFKYVCISKYSFPLSVSQVTETRTGPLGCSNYDSLDSVSSVLVHSPENKIHLKGEAPKTHKHTHTGFCVQSNTRTSSTSIHLPANPLTSCV